MAKKRHRRNPSWHHSENQSQGKDGNGNGKERPDTPPSTPRTMEQILHDAGKECGHQLDPIACNNCLMRLVAGYKLFTLRQMMNRSIQGESRNPRATEILTSYTLSELLATMMLVLGEIIETPATVLSATAVVLQLQARMAVNLTHGDTLAADRFMKHCEQCTECCPNLDPLNPLEPLGRGFELPTAPCPKAREILDGARRKGQAQHKEQQQ